MTELLLQLCDKYQFHCIMNHCSLSHLKYIQISMLCTQAAGWVSKICKTGLLYFYCLQFGALIVVQFCFTEDKR